MSDILSMKDLPEYPEIIYSPEQFLDADTGLPCIKRIIKISYRYIVNNGYEGAVVSDIARELSFKYCPEGFEPLKVDVKTDDLSLHVEFWVIYKKIFRK